MGKYKREIIWKMNNKIADIIQHIHTDSLNKPSKISRLSEKLKHELLHALHKKFTSNILTKVG